MGVPDAQHAGHADRRGVSMACRPRGRRGIGAQGRPSRAGRAGLAGGWRRGASGGGGGQAAGDWDGGRTSRETFRQSPGGRSHQPLTAASFNDRYRLSGVIHRRGGGPPGITRRPGGEELRRRAVRGPIPMAFGAHGWYLFFRFLAPAGQVCERPVVTTTLSLSADPPGGA